MSSHLILLLNHDGVSAQTPSWFIKLTHACWKRNTRTSRNTHLWILTPQVFIQHHCKSFHMYLKDIKFWFVMINVWSYVKTWYRFSSLGFLKECTPCFFGGEAFSPRWSVALSFLKILTFHPEKNWSHYFSRCYVYVCLNSYKCWNSLFQQLCGWRLSLSRLLIHKIMVIHSDQCVNIFCNCYDFTNNKFQHFF